MILNELFNQNVKGYEDPSQDQSIPRLSDVRKVKLTLRQINKLRLLSDIRRIEKEKRLKQIQKQYGSSSAHPVGMM